MDQVTERQLTAALTYAADRPAARLSLLDAVGSDADARAQQRVRAWVLGESGESGAAGEPAPVLAALLAEASLADPVLAENLSRWTTRTLTTGATTPDGGEASRNTFDATRVDGVVVQARNISGGLHLHPAAEAAEPVPRQIPAPPAHFTGRDHELAELERLARAPRQAPAVAVISGPAGVGKSALARGLLGKVADAFPDGLLHADLRGRSPEGPARPTEILAEFLRALGCRQVPYELRELAALWRTVTAEARIAVLLDDALSAAQARPLLPASPTALTLVTSRGRLTGLGLDGAAFRPLGVLDAAHSLELLSRRIGESRVHGEPEAARSVATACGGLPLAVCVAAAHMAARPRQPLAAMARALGENGQHTLDALRVEGESAVRTALDESYRLLPPALGRAYRLLSLAPVGVLDAPVAAAVCAVPPEAAERLLDDLAEVSLLDELGGTAHSGPVRYRFHDLVRAHARRLAGTEDPPEERDAAAARVLDHYLATATAAEQILTPSHRTLRRDYSGPVRQQPPFDDEQGAIQWLDTERGRLMAVLRFAAGSGADDAAWQLADAMWPLFLRLRPYELWLEAHEIGLAAARRTGDRAGERRMLTSGGTGLRNTGRYDEALRWFEEALRAAREDSAEAAGDSTGTAEDSTGTAGDAAARARHRRDEAQALHGLGQTSRLAGRLPEAERYFREALALRADIGYHRGVALSRLCLGDVALAAGQPEQAVGHLERAHGELLAEQDRYDAARALALLGRAYARTGRHAEADRQLLAALDEFTATGSVHWQAHVLEMLGEAAAERGDTERARARYEESRARYAPVSEPDTRRLEDRLRTLGNP
ncbi:ATP-binding protein [Streptomyces boluensis]|uniref:Tetratricopeptide repeat protein n=1 Tax=Streptomyces boluensis TaxID=1775135 RepID=A0A964UWF5_9ACTN|nr:tetratricopeptide repeat protein [Streptomyces boluensis]NBE55580.1 tetratricopeptide repeat protein [Streptomyces boluensis]